MNLTFFDVGAYTGDSAEQMRELFGNRIAKIYAFEPEENNYAQIASRNIPGLSLFPFGLSDKKKTIRFTKSGVFFRVSEDDEQGVSVNVDALDNLELPVFGKAVLKMDVEGAEKDVLAGAAEFIRRHKPYLAICVYHRSHDIYTLPEQVLAIEPEYRFYLRGGMHAVCYGIPK